MVVAPGRESFAAPSGKLPPVRTFARSSDVAFAAKSAGITAGRHGPMGVRGALTTLSVAERLPRGWHSAGRSAPDCSGAAIDGQRGQAIRVAKAWSHGGRCARHLTNSRSTLPEQEEGMGPREALAAPETAEVECGLGDGLIMTLRQDVLGRLHPHEPKCKPHPPVPGAHC